MNFSCDTCRRRYTIADEKVRGKTVKIRCKNCQSIISVTGPADDESTRVISTDEYHAVLAAAVSGAAADPTAGLPKDPWHDEPTLAAPPLNPGDEWFAMLKGQQVGPLGSSALMDRIVSGDINLRTYMWKEGMGDWKRASDVPSFASVLGARAAAPAAPKPPAASVDDFPSPPERDASASAAPAKVEAGLTSDLFSDLEPAAQSQPALGAAPPAASGSKSRSHGRTSSNPFHELGDVDPTKLPASGENTSYFIAQSGMNRRNPVWKIGLFIVALLGLPVGILYMLSELKVVPLEVTRVDGSGQEVKQSVFSAGGVSGLRDLLLGKTAPARKHERERPTHAQGSKDKEPPSTPTPTKVPGGPSSGDLASFYSDKSKSDVGPKIRKHATVASANTADSGGPPEADVAKVVAQSQPAFQYCIEQELKKNPGFKAGKVYLVTTVGSTGVVKTAKIDRHEIDASTLGECLKSKAKRMVFAAFAGDDVDLEIPLILTTSM